MGDSKVIDFLGVACICIVLFQICRFLFGFVYNNFLATLMQINPVNLKNCGNWAVVTGATDGIGKAYAELLAKKGLNIVLISRTQSKLDNVATYIVSKYNVETKTIAVDFTQTENIYYMIDKQLTGLDVGVLVNNVGMSNPHPEYFLDLKNKDQFYTDMINCNIYSVTNMCKIVMPGMVERRRGVIVNISSTSALIPNPLLTVYSATKAYVDKFSQDLSTEYGKYGLTIQCVLPGLVATNMSKIRSSSWMAPSAMKFVAEAMKTIGVHERTTGYFPHTLMVGVINTLKDVSPRLSRWLVTRTMENVRARALRRTAVAS